MVKKSKYKLFSYLIENSLIYYKSLKEKNRIISFAILECLNFKSIFSILNDLLMRRIIQYYSIQIDTNDKSKKVIILNFEESGKENIIKTFNIVQQSIGETYKSIKFLREKVLEEKFLAIIFQDFSSNTTITKNSESILISNENKLKILNFFTIDFDFIENKHTFIINFLDLVNNIGEKGYLILNFNIENTEIIKISPYFVLESKRIDKISDIENKINNFFHSILLKRHNIKIKAFSNYFWRLGINHTFYFLNDYYDLFDSNSSSESLDLSEMNKEFEENLLKNQLDYVRLSKNLLFIEYRFVFLILENLDCKLIYNVIEKYHSKYFIYILILNNLGNKELQEIKSIKLIENIKIVNPIEIRDFNYNQFKINEN